MNIEQIKLSVNNLFNEVIENAKLLKEDIIVLGASSSEVLGHDIGKLPNYDIGYAIADAALNCASKYGIFLAVAGCEHINRSICISVAAAQKYNLEIVNVVPKLNAGGAAATAAYNKIKNPVMVEHISAHAGVDIGNTSIGMHVKFVQVPFKVKIKSIGQANVNCLTSRPKLIGGSRASYLK